MAIGKLLGKPIAWVASLGGGVVSALGVGLLVEVFHMDPTTVLGGAIVTAVGSLAFKFCGWALATYGPKPTNPPAPPSLNVSRPG